MIRLNLCKVGVLFALAVVVACQQPQDPDADLNLHLQEIDESTGFEAENMVVLSGKVKPFRDSSASAGQGLAFWTGSATAPSRARFTATLPLAANRIVVKARGDADPSTADAWPNMVVAVDGQTIFDGRVSSATWTDVPIDVALTAGSHTFDLSFNNDSYGGSSSKDRNLRVDLVRWVAAPVTCTPTTCAAQQKNCGTIPDGCGGTLSCGTCTAPQTCGAEVANVCGGGTVTQSLTFIPTNAVWRYLDDGSNQGTAWRALSFNDGSWKTGAAELGYGDGDEATVVSYGPSSSSKFITTYFRKDFEVTAPSTISSLTLRLKRDDGAVVYLNGVEVLRSNMPTGTISASTLASSQIDESTFHSASLSPAALLAGRNVLAIEVHQGSGSSSDISMAAELTAVSSGPCTPTTCTAEGKNCGTLPDGCGGTLSCGTCTSPQTCGGGGTPNVCGTCTPTTCAAQGKNCGAIADGCGGTLQCGTCSGTNVCTSNVCQAPASFATIAAVGDILGSWTMAKATSDIVIEQGGYDAALILGDLVYPNGRYDCPNCNDFKNEYHPRWGRLNAIAKPVPGNHDYYGDRCDRYPNECLSSDANGAGYYRYFRENNVQVDTFDAVKKAQTEGYYSYDLGNWHIVALNTNWSTCQVVPCSETSAQVDWLKRDLAANTKRCTLAYWHHPRFSSDSSHGNNSTVAPLWNALYAADADLVLNGHAHGYERFGKQSPTAAPDAARGIRQFVVGTGGIGFYSFGSAQANSEVRIGNTYGILKMKLYASTQTDSSGKPYDYEWFFVTTQKDANGNYIVKDSGKDVCH